MRKTEPGWWWIVDQLQLWWGHTAPPGSLFHGFIPEVRIRQMICSPFSSPPIFIIAPRSAPQRKSTEKEWTGMCLGPSSRLKIWWLHYLTLEQLVDFSAYRWVEPQTCHSQSTNSVWGLCLAPRCWKLGTWCSETSQAFNTCSARSCTFLKLTT